METFAGHLSICVYSAEFIADGFSVVTELEYKERPTEISEHAEGDINQFIEFLSVSETNHLNPWGILERPSVGGVQILCRVDPAACFKRSSPQMDLQWSQLLGAILPRFGTLPLVNARTHLLDIQRMVPDQVRMPKLW